MPPAGSEGPPHLVPSVVSGPSSSSSVLPAVTVFEARPFPVSPFDQEPLLPAKVPGSYPLLPVRCPRSRSRSRGRARRRRSGSASRKRNKGRKQKEKKEKRDPQEDQPQEEAGDKAAGKKTGEEGGRDPERPVHCPPHPGNVLPPGRLRPALAVVVRDSARQRYSAPLTGPIPPGRLGTSSSSSTCPGPSVLSPASPSGPAGAPVKN